MFRNLTYRELCATCRDVAGSDCDRCHKPLCAAHAPQDDELCGGCQSHYERRLASVRAVYRTIGWLVLSVGNLAILSASRSLGHGVASLPIVAIATLLTWSFFVWMLGMPADAVFRKKFIRACRR